MLRALEIAWLLITLVGAGLGVFKLVTENFSVAIWFFLLMMISMVFWLVRRSQRIREEKLM